MYIHDDDDDDYVFASNLKQFTNNPTRISTVFANCPKLTITPIAPDMYTYMYTDIHSTYRS